MKLTVKVIMEETPENPNLQSKKNKVPKKKKKN